MQPPKQSLVFGFVVVPNFSLIALSACVDPLRIANSVLGKSVYRSVEWLRRRSVALRGVVE